MIFHGTHKRMNPPTSWRQVTQLPKLFMAKLTRQSSHMQRQRQGQVMIDRGLVWQTTQGGPLGPNPVAPDSHVSGSELDAAVERRSSISCSSISISSSAVGLRCLLWKCAAGWLWRREDNSTRDFSLSSCCWYWLRVMMGREVRSELRCAARMRASSLLSRSRGSRSRAKELISMKESWSGDASRDRSAYGFDWVGVRRPSDG